MKRKSLRTLVCALFASLALTTFTFADSGPKPQLTVRVKDAPAHVCRPRRIFGDVHAAAENGFDFICVCGRKLCEALQNDGRRLQPPPVSS